VGEDVFLQLLEQKRIVLVIIREWSMLSHGFLPEWIDSSDGHVPFSPIPNPRRIFFNARWQRTRMLASEVPTISATSLHRVRLCRRRRARRTSGGVPCKITSKSSAESTGRNGFWTGAEGSRTKLKPRSSLRSCRHRANPTAPTEAPESAHRQVPLLQSPMHPKRTTTCVSVSSQSPRATAVEPANTSGCPYSTR